MICDICSYEDFDDHHFEYYADGQTDEATHSVKCKECGFVATEEHSDKSPADGKCDKCEYVLPQTKLVYTLDTAKTKGTNNSYASSCDVTISGIKWNIEGNSQMLPWRFGGKNISSPTDRKLSSKTVLSYDITKIIIKGKTTTITLNSTTLKVFDGDPTKSTSKVIDTITVTFDSNGDATIQRPTNHDWNNCYYQIVFNVTNDSSENKFVTINTVEFYA